MNVYLYFHVFEMHSLLKKLRVLFTITLLLRLSVILYELFLQKDLSISTKSVKYKVHDAKHDIEYDVSEMFYVWMSRAYRSSSIIMVCKNRAQKFYMKCSYYAVAVTNT